MMIHTNELEIQQTSGTSYIDCFKNADLRRTELTVMTWVIQQTSGSPMMGWGTYFLLQVGLSGDSAYSIGVGQSAMGFVGTVASWVGRSHSQTGLHAEFNSEFGIHWRCVEVVAYGLSANRSLVLSEDFRSLMCIVVHSS